MTVVLATNLYKAARKVKPAGRTSNPILACIRLSHVDGRLCLTTWHPDEPMIEYVSARTDGDLFETCVPARAFTDWLYVTQNKPTRANPHNADQIELTLDSNLQILHIKAGNTRAQFKCIDAREFPDCTSAAVAQFEAIANAPVFQNA